MTTEAIIALALMEKRARDENWNGQHNRSTHEIALLPVEGPSIIERVRNAASRLMHLQAEIDVKDTDLSAIENKRQTQLG